MPDTTPIHHTLARVAAEWNAGDATAYGAEFTADATYVTVDGHVLVGRYAIVEVHRWLFDGPPKGSTMGPRANRRPSAT